MQLSQIAKTVQLFGLKKGWKNDMPVLGLAGRHRQWKIEAGTQS